VLFLFGGKCKKYRSVGWGVCAFFGELLGSVFFRRMACGMHCGVVAKHVGLGWLPLGLPPNGHRRQLKPYHFLH
jgi:hypothetical protein